MDLTIIETVLRVALIALFGLVSIFGLATALQLISVNLLLHRMARQQQETIDGIYAAYKEQKQQESDLQEARRAELATE